jgi:hypothetical protein
LPNGQLRKKRTYATNHIVLHNLRMNLVRRLRYRYGDMVCVVLPKIITGTCYKFSAKPLRRKENYVHNGTCTHYLFFSIYLPITRLVRIICSSAAVATLFRGDGRHLQDF